MLIHGITVLDQNRSIQPPALESGPEIENFYYGRWNKSFRQTFAQMAVAHILGSTNLNISLYDFMGNRPDDEPGAPAFLKQVRPSLDWLADQVPIDDSERRGGRALVAGDGPDDAHRARRVVV